MEGRAVSDDAIAMQHRKERGGQGRSEDGIGGHERRWEYLLC